MTNPLDDLAVFSSASQSASQPRIHSSGRRELRRQWFDRGVSLLVRPADDAAKIAMAKGEFVASLPIRRAERKRPEGMSARQWKRKKKQDRNSD